MAKMNCSKEEIDMDWRYTPVPTLSKDFTHSYKAIHNNLVVTLRKLVIVAKLFETYLKLILVYIKGTTTVLSDNQLLKSN